MALYIGITAWFFVLLFLGLRPDSVLAAESWPKLPEDKKAKRNEIIVSVLTCLSFLFLWVLTAFRSANIGNDTHNYLALFDKFIGVGVAPEKYKYEIGFRYLNILMYKITQSRHVFLIVVATIMYAGVGAYIFKFSKNRAVSLCFFFSCFFSMFTSILRQGIAMVIILYGYQLLKNGKKLLAALLFLLAASFHTTALVSFLLFFDLKIWEKMWVVFGLTVLCAIVSRFGVFKAVIDLIAPMYSHYFTGQYASSGWLAITFYLLLYSVLYFFVNRSLDENNRQDRTVATNFALLLFFTAFGYAVNLFDRIGSYFLFIAISELPNVLYRGKEKHFRFWLFAICAVMLVMFVLILIYRPGWNYLYPYEFWPDSFFDKLFSVK